MNMSFFESVKSRCPDIISNVHIVTESDWALPDVVPKAVIFVHATWSAASGAALAALGQALPSSTAADALIFVIDADSIVNGLRIGTETELPQGRGETYLVRDRKIIERISDYNLLSVAKIIEALRRAFP